jgi:hypothetical protein
MRHVDSPISGVIPCFYSHYLGHRSIDFRRLVTPALQRVTSTLHGRNAEKNFAGKTPRISITFRIFACNVAQVTAKFHQNPAVSDAVDSSIDCMMLNGNFTTDFTHWPTAARIFSLLAPHGHDASLPHTVDGGAR